MGSPSLTSLPPLALALPQVGTNSDSFDEMKAAIRDGKCLRYNGISVLSNNAESLLTSKHVLELVSSDRYYDLAWTITINSKEHLIPRWLTSRGTLDFVGFTEVAVGEIWNYIKENALPMKDSYPFASAIDEFWDAVIKWYDHNVAHMIRHEKKIVDKRPELMLNFLGIKNEVQKLPMRLSTPNPETDDTFQLNRIHTDIVPVWTKRYITRRWNVLKKMNGLVLAQDEGWWEKIAREMDWMTPLDSMEAYTTTNVYLPLEKVLEIGGIIVPNTLRVGY